MTGGELVPLFEGHEIHPIEHNGEVWIPLADLATAWGVDRKTPGNLIGRNQELFAGMFRSDGDVTYHDVNERGLYLLMGKISADRLKNPEAKAAMIRFQRWVPELIQKFRKGEIVQDQQLDEIVAYDLIEAKQIAKLIDTDPKILQAAILRKHGYPEYADVLLPMPSIIQHGEAGVWFTVTQLGREAGEPDRPIQPERINYYLMNHGFQYRDGPIWRLTSLGMEHGEEYPYPTVNKHVEVRIRWRESVLYASGLKRPISTDQAALTAPAHG